MERGRVIAVNPLDISQGSAPLVLSSIRGSLYRVVAAPHIALPRGEPRVSSSA
jgi:hypothetical protein